MADRYLNPSEAAERLGVSPKALRLYETRGLIAPPRTGAGWRAYGPAEMALASEIVALRALGLSLSQTAAVLEGDADVLDAALAKHQLVLESDAARIAEAMARVQAIRARLAQGGPARPAVADLAMSSPRLTLTLPWPWGGETLDLPALPPLTWLVGPLGSGKTRLAVALAECVGGRFVGLDRAEAPGPADHEALDWLAGEGAAMTPALEALIAHLQGPPKTLVVVDLVEQGLDAATQVALAAWLRRSDRSGPRLVLMTRSSAMLDLEAAAPAEVILYCPANHSPPILVAPRPGSPGFESVAGCLAPPDVRARTEGMMAVLPAA